MGAGFVAASWADLMLTDVSDARVCPLLSLSTVHRQHQGSTMSTLKALCNPEDSWLGVQPL